VTDWGSLSHAYGAARDTPAHLAALLGEDEDARLVALDHLDAAVLGDDRLWSATPVVVAAVVDLLDASPERAALLDWVRDVARVVAAYAREGYADPAASAVPVAAVLAAALGAVEDPDLVVRHSAYGAVAVLVTVPELAPERAGAHARLREAAPAGTAERAQLLLALSAAGVLDPDWLD
jgi:hypothetical protein